jgi:hypothetical protein
MTSCTCIADFNKRLEQHNTRIDEGLMRINGDWVTRPTIASEQIERGRGKKKAVRIVPTFCPFCGTPYDQDAASEPVQLPVPSDVRRLVIAARVIAYQDDGADADDHRALDAALEAFANRVPWDEMPEPGPAQPDVEAIAELQRLTLENGPIVIDKHGDGLAWRPLDYGTWTALTTPAETRSDHVFDHQLNTTAVVSHETGSDVTQAAKTRSEVTPLERFGAKMFDQIFERFCEGDWEIEVNDLITDDALAAGLVQVEDFDPNEHTDVNGACSPGDPFYIITDAGRHARAIARGKSLSPDQQSGGER